MKRVGSWQMPGPNLRKEAGAAVALGSVPRKQSESLMSRSLYSMQRGCCGGSLLENGIEIERPIRPNGGAAPKAPLPQVPAALPAAAYKSPPWGSGCAADASPQTKGAVKRRNPSVSRPKTRYCASRYPTASTPAKYPLHRAKVSAEMVPSM